MDKQQIIFKDLGIIDYKSAWDYQEELVKENLEIKAEVRQAVHSPQSTDNRKQSAVDRRPMWTVDCQTIFYSASIHPFIHFGKSGDMKNVLLSESEMDEKEIEFFKTNRGGDITFHGLQQVVGYPILDLENFYTDIGKYLRSLEEVIIRTIAEYGIRRR